MFLPCRWWIRAHVFSGRVPRGKVALSSSSLLRCSRSSCLIGTIPNHRGRPSGLDTQLKARILPYTARACSTSGTYAKMRHSPVGPWRSVEPGTVPVKTSVDHGTMTTTFLPPPLSLFHAPADSSLRVTSFSPPFSVVPLSPKLRYHHHDHVSTPQVVESSRTL